MFLILAEVIQHIFIQLLEVQKKMFSFPQHWNRAIIPAARVDQFGWVQQGFSITALVTSCALIATNWTGPFYIAVRQETPFRLRIKLLLGMEVEKISLVASQENVLRDPMMVLRIGMGK